MKVSTREAWFPELERVLNSGKEEYFVPENTRAFGAPCRPGLTLHGWGGESGSTAAGRDCWPQVPRRPPPAPGRRGGLGSRPLSTSLYRLHCFSLHSPSPPGRGDTMDTETVEQGCKATSFPYLPPTCRMHSYNSRYKIKKQ